MCQSNTKWLLVLWTVSHTCVTDNPIQSDSLVVWTVSHTCVTDSPTQSDSLVLRTVSQTVSLTSLGPLLWHDLRLTEQSVRQLVLIWPRSLQVKWQTQKVSEWQNLLCRCDKTYCVGVTKPIVSGWRNLLCRGDKTRRVGMTKHVGAIKYVEVTKRVRVTECVGMTKRVQVTRLTSRMGKKTCVGETKRVVSEMLSQQPPHT